MTTETTEYPTRIDLCDGKYTVIYDFRTGQSECLSYGEKWRDLCGDKMVLAMFDEIVELRSNHAKVEDEATRLHTELLTLHSIIMCPGDCPATAESDSLTVRSLKGYIAAVGKRVKELEAELTTGVQLVSDLEAANTTKASLITGLESDAENYQWLRDRMSVAPSGLLELPQLYVPNPECEHLTGERLDEALRAVRTKESKP